MSRRGRDTETMSAHISTNSLWFLKCGFSSANRRKVSSACVIILLLFLQETICQDKQSKSSAKPESSVDSSHSATLIPSFPNLYSCCGEVSSENANSITTTDPSGSELSNCELLTTEIDDDNMISQRMRNFTILKQPKGMRCSNQETIIIPLESIKAESQNRTLLNNGYLKVKTEYFAPDEFCVHKITEDEIQFLVCPTDCKKRLCVRKCCDLDKLLSLRTDPNKMKIGCELRTAEGRDFRLPIYHDYSKKVTKAEENNSLMPHYIISPQASFKWECYKNNTNFLLNSQLFVDKIANHTGIVMVKSYFRVRTDGNILYRHINGECKTHSENFCIEGIQSYEVDGEHFMSSEDEIAHVTCAVEVQLPGGDAVSEVFGPLMLSVSIFPFLTTLVYVLLWKKQTIHGWTIVSTSTSLLFMYIFIGTSHVLRLQYGTTIHYTKICVFIAVAAHFFFLTTFSWLTVMCFDLWWTFRTLAPRNRQSKGIKRFINYAIFGWGIPTTIVAVSLFIHHMEDNCVDNLIVPAYGRESCYLTARAMGVYLYFPSIAFLTINIIFFSVTCMKLYQYRQSCQMANKTDMKECFSRFAKLFFVMGITWMFEIVSWCIGGLGFTWYWAIFDIINILRAVAVFIIYVCKRDILASLEESYPQFKKLSRPAAEYAMNSMGISKDTATTTTIVPSCSSNPASKTSSADCTQL